MESNYYWKKLTSHTTLLLNSISDAIYISVLFIAYLFGKLFLSKKKSDLSVMDSISQLSTKVVRILGHNPGPFTLQGTNTYLVGSSNERILIDCGESGVQSYVDDLIKALGDATITSIICTHWHQDHVGGILDIFKHVTNGPVPVYKFERTDYPVTKEIIYNYITPGHVIKSPGVTLRCIATPGHTSDHMSIYFEEEKSLFSGDCILGEGTSIFEDLHDYMHSLKILSNLNIIRIYPGHGKVIEKGLEKISEYINHREKREDEILETLKRLSIASCVRDIPWSVKLGAVNNVRKHLIKLEKENRIRQIGFDNYCLK
ncbi:unnamed protein product [Thelazia callipaeda]|uniref:Beta-lactamase-like protein 2 homolog n=1 Tax=Thelazia callipaeda TaxID=103827 RepID=A0A0N5D2N9_THECL|nr:unnamed protein product [Thelazia callipaeda]